MAVKECIVCGEVFSDAVFNTCPECRREFIDNINKMVEEILREQKQ